MYMSTNSLEIKTNEQHAPIQQIMPLKSIDRYCNLQKKNGLTRMNGCFQALPLSKKYSNYGNEPNDFSGILRNKMKYAEYVRIHGITENSSSSFKKTSTFDTYKSFGRYKY